MHNINITDYTEQVDRGEVMASFKVLKTLYELTNNALANIAQQVNVSHEALMLEEQLLNDKDMLLALASKTRGKNMSEISQKLDFLNTVHLKEISPEEYSYTDLLTKSIWEDCQIYL